MLFCFKKINVGNCTPTNLRYLVNFDEVWGDCVTAARVTGKDSNGDDDDGDDGDHDIILSSIVVIKNAAKEGGRDLQFVDMKFEMVEVRDQNVHLFLRTK